MSSRQVLSDRFVAVLLILSGCALAPTHELSPYIIGGVLIVLAVFRCARPRWAGLAILIPAGLWALLNQGVFGGYVSLANLFNLANFAPPRTPTAPGISRLPIVGYTALTPSPSACSSWLSARSSASLATAANAGPGLI